MMSNCSDGKPYQSLSNLGVGELWREKKQKKVSIKKTRLIVGSLILFQQQTSVSQFSIDSGTCQSKRPNATHL